MDDLESLTQSEKLLLMAAAVLRLGPRKDISTANTYKVVAQAMVWSGLSEEAAERGVINPDCEPAVAEIFATLVRMVHGDGGGQLSGQPDRPLFEGCGNWGEPGNRIETATWPRYSSCRLTACGERMARQLLEEHPEYRKST